MDCVSTMYFVSIHSFSTTKVHCFSSAGNKAARYSTPIPKASRAAVIAVVFINTLPPCETLSNSPFVFRIHDTQAAAPFPLLRLAPSNGKNDAIPRSSYTRCLRFNLMCRRTMQKQSSQRDGTIISRILTTQTPCKDRMKDLQCSTCFHGQKT